MWDEIGQLMNLNIVLIGRHEQQEEILSWFCFGKKFGNKTQFHPIIEVTSKKKFCYKETSYLLSLTATASQHEYDELVKSYLQEADICIVCINLKNCDNHKNLSLHVQPFLQLRDSLKKGTPMLLACHSECQEMEQYFSENIKQLNIPFAFYNAETGGGVTAIIEKAIEVIEGYLENYYQRIQFIQKIIVLACNKNNESSWVKLPNNIQLNIFRFLYSFEEIGKTPEQLVGCAQFIINNKQSIRKFMQERKTFKIVEKIGNDQSRLFSVKERDPAVVSRLPRSHRSLRCSLV